MRPADGWLVKRGVRKYPSVQLVASYHFGPRSARHGIVQGPYAGFYARFPIRNGLVGKLSRPLPVRLLSTPRIPALGWSKHLPGEEQQLRLIGAVGGVQLQA